MGSQLSTFLLVCIDFDLDHRETAQGASQPLHLLLNSLAAGNPQIENLGHLEAFRKEDEGLLDA